MSQVLGTLLGLLMVMMGIPLLLQYQSQAAENQRMAATAQQAILLNGAVQNYLVQNAISLQATASATSPVTIGLANLQNAGDLSSGFSGTNPYGQSWNVQVLQPVAGTLQALVGTVGGAVLSDKQGSSIASLIGAAGGFLPQNDSGVYPEGAATAVGAYGGWSLATTNYVNLQGGHLASLVGFGSAQSQANYLWRNAVPGQPQLNSMNTPLILNTVQTSGAACSNTGAIAQDGTGLLLACRNGSWTTTSGLPPWICVQYQSYWASGILQDHNFSVFFSNTNQTAGSEGNGWMVVCGVS
jgi:hypothetical protein